MLTRSFLLWLMLSASFLLPCLFVALWWARRKRVRTVRLVRLANDTILRKIPDGLVVLDDRDQVTAINAAARDFFGATTVRLGSSFDDLARALHLPGLAPGQDEQVFETRLFNQHLYQVVVTPLTDPFQRLAGRLVILYDVTRGQGDHLLRVQRERLNTAMQQEREIGRLKGQIMTRIAHEFRTPLAAIQLNTEMLVRYLNKLTPEQQNERVDTIREQINHLTGMLDSISHAVRGETLDRARAWNHVPLRAVIERVAASLDLERTHTVAYDFDSHTDLIQTDAVLLASIVRHLLANAALYSPAGSGIRIRVRCDADDFLIAVTDQGIGIPTAELRYIFEPFYRGSNIEERRGIGLGLSLVTNAVQALGGRVTAQSVPGHETTFTVRLPMRIPDADQVALAASVIDAPTKPTPLWAGARLPTMSRTDVFSGSAPQPGD
ncbi:MAG: ATP-binding protein [bacterium]|nr:ATP-binding protein [bacterium]